MRDSIEAETVSAPEILIVEDEEGIRLILRRCLEAAGFRVQAVPTGEEALETYALTKQTDPRIRKVG